jgi:3-hydroxybutyryl-CoA dehydrogenase
MTTVAVIGAGTMGIGIAYVSAVAGHEVRITDVSEQALERALAQIDRAFDSGVQRGKLDETARTQAAARISAAATLEDSVADADVVIEAAPEIMLLKQRLFEQIAAAAPPTALLATNTSSLSVSAIAAVTSRPEQVAGLHFFNPVAAMKLVEIVRGDQTGDAAVARARDFAASLGKTTIVVGDSAGFATSRLGVVLGLEAMRMLEQGVATAADIDTAMELGYNHPVGPLRLTDIVGLDVRLAVADRLHSALGDATYAAPDILRELVAAGRLGKKTGQGFYTWPAIP